MPDNARIDRENRGDEAAHDRHGEDEIDRHERTDEDDAKGRDVPPPKSGRDPKGPWMGGG